MAEEKNVTDADETAKATDKAEAKSEAKSASKPAKAEADQAKAEAKPAKKASGAEEKAAKADTKADDAKAAKKAPAKKAKADAEDDAKPSKSAKAEAAQEPAEPAVNLLKTHHLRPAPGSHTAKTRVGRGEASKGKTAGRGTKGTKARQQVPARLEGGQMPMHMRLPKLRGFKNPAKVTYQVVNLDRLSALYPDGGEVTVADLVDKGAVRKGCLVKVLGTGEVSVKLDVAVDAYSSSAKEKIVAAGGTVNEG